MDLLIDYVMKIHYRAVRGLLNGYKAPDDASDEFKEVVYRLSEFSRDLREHTHVENDFIYPGVLKVLQDSFGLGTISTVDEDIDTSHEVSALLVIFVLQKNI